MYVDFSPVPNARAAKVIVVQSTDRPYTSMLGEQIIQKARMSDATSRDGDNHEIFWIVYDDDPKRAWDMTEHELRTSFRRPRTERFSEEQLLAIKRDAPIAEVLETFELGDLGSHARKELPLFCINNEVVTIGDLAKHTRVEVAGPHARSAGNKTISYLEAVFSRFGLEFAKTPAVA